MALSALIVKFSDLRKRSPEGMKRRPQPSCYPPRCGRPWDRADGHRTSSSSKQKGHPAHGVQLPVSAHGWSDRCASSEVSASRMRRSSRGSGGAQHPRDD